MKAKKKALYFHCLFLILTLSICSPPPPEPKPMEQMQQIIYPVVNEKDKGNLSFKRLEAGESYIKLDQSKVVISFNENYRTIEHQLTVGAYNLESGRYYPGWSFYSPREGITLEEITNTCKITNSDGSSEKECTATQGIYETDNTYILFKYDGKIYNGDKLIIEYKYNQTKTTKQILYKQEPIIIPLISGSSYCDYEFKIPEDYIDLGLENNLLTKTAERTYSFKGDCPNPSIDESIRYSPEEVMWKAETEFSLESSDKLTNDITFGFSRYYRGGKLNNTFYRIVSSENEFYKENKIIDEINKLKIKIPAPNKNKASVALHTAFFNRLTDQFKVIVPESSYQINLTAIDQEIKDKANQIITENIDKPNYYKIGKFVHSHIKYDINYVGHDMSLKEIYEKKIGVCHHYTLLYNAMLNAIGIKTLYISGWAFQNEEIAGNKSSLSHAWTAAYIEDKGWIELDATWGLFEGIPAGHIIKNFGSDSYYYATSQSTNVNINFEVTPLIQMITDPEEMVDPYPPIEDDEEEDKTDENKKDDTNGENNESDNVKNNPVNKTDDAENSAKINYMNIYIGLLIIIFLGL